MTEVQFQKESKMVQKSVDQSEIDVTLKILSQEVESLH